MTQEVETNIVGKDVWWDTTLQKFRKKRLNLDKIPLKFRCPSCGKIVVKPVAGLAVPVAVRKERRKPWNTS